MRSGSIYLDLEPEKFWKHQKQRRNDHNNRYCMQQYAYFAQRAMIFINAINFYSDCIVQTIYA